MSNRRFLPGSIKLPEQELATTTIIIALMLIPESVLVQEGHTIKKNTCGIDARMKLLDNGERHIKAMGYIFVQ